MDAQEPLAPCDLVMKGGVASGVVYSGLLKELYPKFQFRGIGGTSAGAIAAVLAAAAEYRRQVRGVNTGFEQVANLGAELGESKDGRGSRLARLFAPSRSTSRLFGHLLKMLEARSSLGKALVALHFFWPQLLLYPGLAVAGVYYLGRSGLDPVLCALAGVVLSLSSLIPVFLHLKTVVATVVDNDYGLCPGYSPGGEDLVNWLYDKIQKVAELPLSEPLTFAHLEGRPELSELIKGAGIACMNPSQSVQLRLIATCLSHGRPYKFPMIGDALYFSEHEMRKYFPPEVVDWMVKYGKPVKPDGYVIAKGKATCPFFLVRPQGSEGKPLLFVRHVQPNDKGGESFKRFPCFQADEELRERVYYTLPTDGLLPVIVATRLSLSVPGLFCSLNFYAKDFSRIWTYDDTRYVTAERVVFTDGGISSNLPIHLFDAILPLRPTLAVNLSKYPPGPERTRDIGYATSNNHGASYERWDRFEKGFDKGTLWSFLGSVFESARNWNDNIQLRRPGCRDRLVDIYLSEDEGGFNLNMSEGTIEKLYQRGAAAGKKLWRLRPNAPEEMNLRNHLWIRYRVAMYLISCQLSQMAEVLRSESYQELLDPANELPGYPFSDQTMVASWNGDLVEPDEGARPKREHHVTAQEQTQKLLDFIENWDGTVFARHNLPSPLPVLRVTRDT